MSLVLNTGSYPPLMETRRLVLEHAGHIVITQAEDLQIVEVCRTYQFDVVVIGQSAAAPVKRRIFHLVRRHCKSAKILELVSADSGRALEDADSWLEIHPMEADTLTERVNELAGDARH